MKKTKNFKIQKIVYNRTALTNKTMNKIQIIIKQKFRDYNKNFKIQYKL